MYVKVYGFQYNALQILLVMVILVNGDDLCEQVSGGKLDYGGDGNGDGGECH